MASTTKVKKENSKKVESKSTRKVASISLLGILFFMLMLGILRCHIHGFHVHRNTTSDHRAGKNRRILGRLPLHLVGSDNNITNREARRSMKGEDLSAKKSLSSSTVVSVLVDPREAVDGDIDIDGVIRPKSISRIFIVVLTDSIKYMTYSCVLPRSGVGMHFVTA